MRNQSGFSIEALPSVSPERKTELQLLERQLSVRFKNYELFNLAFCHRSYTNEVSEDISNNEKLELLGDSVLGLSVVDYLYRNYPDKNEGDLAKIKSHVVSEAVLSEIGFELGIDNYILIGHGEEVGGGRTRKAVLEDCMEALFGAYFLDCGDFEDAQKLVLRFLVPKIEDVVANRHQKDYKSLIQEYSQKQLKTRPQYSVVGQSGPDHNRTYKVMVAIGSKSFGPATGASRKEAEQHTAELAYKALVESETPAESATDQSATKTQGPKAVKRKPAHSSTTNKPKGATSLTKRKPATQKVSTPKRAASSTRGVAAKRVATSSRSVAAKRAAASSRSVAAKPKRAATSHQTVATSHRPTTPQRAVASSKTASSSKRTTPQRASLATKPTKPAQSKKLTQSTKSAQSKKPARKVATKISPQKKG